jgi:hypothetical protein
MKYIKQIEELQSIENPTEVDMLRVERYYAVEKSGKNIEIFIYVYGKNVKEYNIQYSTYLGITGETTLINKADFFTQYNEALISYNQFLLNNF